MKCPNCGKQVRSKTRCAYCGHQFDGSESTHVHAKPEPQRDELKDIKTTDEVAAGVAAGQSRVDDFEKTRVLGTVDNVDNLEETRVHRTIDSRLDNREEPQFATTDEATRTRSSRVSDDELERYIEDSEVIPKTKRRGSVLGFLWNIIKLLLVVFLLFLLIAFGPKYGKQLWEKYGFGNQNQPSTSEQVVSTESDENTPNSTEESDLLANNSQNDDTNKEDDSTKDENTTKEGETTQEGETTKEDETSSDQPNQTENAVVAKSAVNLDQYPLTEIELELADDQKEIKREDLNISVDIDGEIQEIQDYSLVQEGKQLKIAFNNPAMQVIASEQPKQLVKVQSEALNIDESLDVELPKTTVDGEKFENFNQILTDNLSETGSLSAAFKKNGEDSPYIYADSSFDASQLFSWYILNRTLSAINEGEIDLETKVKVLDDLKAEGDNGAIASAEENTEFTIETLMYEVIQQQDASAMNHLIQATGGPNDFNLWLSKNHYFATKVTELLNVNDEGHITGTVTNAQDLLLLLEKLANNQLVSEELDAKFKEMLLETPITRKYPDGFESVTRRYEIASNDIDSTSQGYAAILETEDGQYLVVTNVANPKDTDTTVSSIANSIRQLVSYFMTGEIPSEEETTEEAPVEEPVVEEVPEEEYVEPVTEAPVVEQTEAPGFQYGEDLDGDGMPDSVYDPNTGGYRNINWFQDEDGSNKFYYAE